MVAVKIPVQYKAPDKPNIPVKITNPDTNKAITIPMLVDTGWEINRIDNKYGDQLGFNPTKAISKTAEYDIYLGLMTIGTLKPLTTYVLVSVGNPGLNVFGALAMRQFGSFVITKDYVIAADSTTGGNTPQGLVNAMKDFSKYTFPGGIPKLVAAKQALYAASRSNSGAYWRNRI